MKDLPFWAKWALGVCLVSGILTFTLLIIAVMSAIGVIQ